MLTKIKNNKPTKPNLTIQAIDEMNNIQLNAKKFQRIARKFFKTQIINDTVYLKNNENYNTAEIDFNYDMNNDYMRILYATWLKTEHKYIYTNVQFKKPLYVRDVFIYLLKYPFLICQ